jgi:probable phosphoglycerate mutase
MTVMICLVRHGRTSFGERGLLCGWSDPPLDDVGRLQAEGLARRLEGRAFDRVWSSDLERARVTARIVAGFDPILDMRLRELDLGSLDGMTFDDCAAEVQAGLIAFDGFHAPGGESVTSLEQRVNAFFAELDPGTHLVVTHGGVIRLLLRAEGQGDRSVGPCEIVELTLPPEWQTAHNRYAP